MDANRADTAFDFNLTGQFMATIRSANRRHQRAIVSTIARGKAAEVVVEPKVQPAQAIA